MIRNFIFISALWISLLLSSCATILDRDQVVSVDSDPRGAKVYLPDKSEMPAGTTPFFLSVDRGKTLKLNYDFGDKKLIAEEKTCRYQWQKQLTTNGLITIATFGIGLVGFGIDKWTGAAYDCGPGILARHDQGQTFIGCRAILVAPPYQPLNQNVSDEIAKAWIDRVEKDLGPCDEILSYEDGKILLQNIGIFSTTPHQLQVLQAREDFSILGGPSKSTDIVILDGQDQPDGIHIKPVLYDMHRRKVVVDAAMPEMDLVTSSRVAANDGFFWRRHVRFTPNSLSYNFFRPTPQVAADSGYVLIQNDFNSNMFDYLGGWEINRVESNAGHIGWSFSWGIHPSADTRTISQHIETVSQTTGVHDDVNVQILFVDTQAALTGNLISPAGVFALSFGVGPTLAMGTGGSRSRLEDMGMGNGRIALEYQYFTDVGTHFKFGFERIARNSKLAQSNVHIDRYMTSVIGSLGYFIPVNLP